MYERNLINFLTNFDITFYTASMTILNLLMTVLTNYYHSFLKIIGQYTSIKAIFHQWRNFVTVMKLSAASRRETYNIIVDFLSPIQSPCILRLGSYKLIYVDKPEDLQIVLNHSNALGKSFIYDFFKMGVGEGIFSAPVHKWKKHRRLIAPVFKSRLLSNFLPTFNAKNSNLVAKLEKETDTNRAIDLWEPLSATALDIICETAMEFDANTDECAKKNFQNAIVTGAALAAARVFQYWFHSNLIFYPYMILKRKMLMLYHLRELPVQVIKKSKIGWKEKQKSSAGTERIPENGHITFLDTLLRLNERAAITDEDLYDEVVTMMVTGSETSAVTNCFTLLMLAMHPEVQDKAYKEVISVLGEEDRFIGMEDVRKLPYLEQCIKETLRLFPTAMLILREASGNIQLSNNFVIPAGADILIPAIAVHRNPQIYDNPLIWNPDNFGPDEIQKRHRYSFLGFSAGPRGCIGTKYAILSMKVTLSKILRKYYLETEAKLDDIVLQLDLLLRSVNGYKVKFYSRRK